MQANKPAIHFSLGNASVMKSFLYTLSFPVCRFLAVLREQLKACSSVDGRRSIEGEKVASLCIGRQRQGGNCMWQYARLPLMLMLGTFLPSPVCAQEPVDTDSVVPVAERQVQEVEVVARRAATRRMRGAMNGMEIGRDELFRAACCNLGESFTTNPPVDVSYSDAATGARQVKLLGLSGTYVQLMTENLPNFRGAAQPYALGYVPGPWMKNIQVSKGAASVRNGYESMTGQINVQYLQPEDDEGVTANVYGNTMGRLEVNADANMHLSPLLSTEFLLHHENNWSHHDGNHDTFLDQPKVRQYNVQNRWAYLGNTYIFHGGLSLLREARRGGQTEHTLGSSHTTINPLFTIDIDTRRYEAYMKHAVILDKEHGTNVALMTSTSMHEH